MLKPGGSPSSTSRRCRILRGNHSVLSAELRRYSRAGLRTLLEAAGFRVERMTYTNAALFPVMLAVRGVQRADGAGAGKRSRGRNHGPAAPVNAALGALLAVEAGVARAMPMPFGSSLLCLARKPA